MVIVQEGQRVCKENFLKKAIIMVDSKIRLEAGYLPDSVIRTLERRLIFSNPQWEENEKRGFSNWNTPEKLSYLYRHGEHLTMPRGFLIQLLNILKYNGIDYELKDYTRKLPELIFNFKGKLYPFQKIAAHKILSCRHGVLSSPTGSGKTVIALYVVAQRRQPTLVITHTKTLLHQWRERAIEFLGLSENEIGLIGDGKNEIGSKLTIGIINSVYKNVHDIKKHIGFLIVDECHKVPARTFVEGVKAFDCKYLLGLSATPYRRDKLSRVIYYHMGDKVYEIEPKELQDIKKIMTASLRITETGFGYLYADDYQNMIADLTNDFNRNKIIVKDVVNQSNIDGGIVLVLSSRKKHCKTLCSLIEAEGIKARLLLGETNGGERKKIVEELNEGTVKVLISTISLVGEGFDSKALSSIFITTPITFSGRTKQCVGRILRTAEGKNSATIFDYRDEVGILRYSFKNRLHTYKSLGVNFE